MKFKKVNFTSQRAVIILIHLLLAIMVSSCNKNKDCNEIPEQNIETECVTTCCTSTECTTKSTTTTTTTTTTSETTNSTTTTCVTTCETTTCNDTTTCTECVIELTDAVVEDVVNEEIEQVIEDVPNVETEILDNNEYVVYKPSTKYVHRSICRWNKDDAEIIYDTNGIVARLCSECNPDIEIVNYYIEPQIETIQEVQYKDYSTNSICLSDYDVELLRQIVQHEAGSSWISTYDKARVAAGVMNRVNDSRFPNSIYDVLTQPNQFSGFWPDCTSYSQGAIDAVDYYLNHSSEFGNENSWYGDGTQNYFYYQ